MKLPIGHKLTLSGYEVEVVPTIEYRTCGDTCPFSNELHQCKTITNNGCLRVLGHFAQFKLIKNLRPDRSK